VTLGKGDDYPIHQTSEPIAFAGTDRNFYDRYFFNGYSAEAGDTSFFAAAFGVYPHLNIADAAFVVVRNGVETALHASRCLEMERMDLSVGPISIEVVEPLKTLRVKVNAPDQRMAAEVTFTGRSVPIEEPRFIRRIGPRTLMDYTRLTQNGRYHGWIELDGVKQSIDGFVGTRDRSWGVRTIGARDPLTDGDWQREFSFKPVYNFFMLGLGYGHPKWAHGLNHGGLAIEREDIVLKDVDLRVPHHLHIQALCEVSYRDESGRTHQGRGVLEQLALGPHAPSGFKSTLDFAP
jgi:hypothetical protein